jgi:spore coat protein U-like protein
MMKRLRLAVLAIALCSTPNLHGQSSSASLTVSANVSKNCTITTAPVNFGAYDPVAGNSTAPLDGTGIVTVTCTKGAVATVGLNNGGNGQTGTRRMKSGSSGTDYLNYQLYQDSGRSQLWDDAGNQLALGSAPNAKPRSFTVYGRVPGMQDVTVGAYNDTVLATVNF